MGMTFRQWMLVGGMVLGAAAPAWAQTVTSADLTRLEASAVEIARQVEVLKKTDVTLAADVSRTLGELNSEITYLTVKMRREGSVTRPEYVEIRDRVETLRVKAATAALTAKPVVTEPERTYKVPVGTLFDVRLQGPISSGTARVEERFEATTLLDYSDNGRVVLPAGSLVRGFVSSVRPAGKIDRRGSITLSFDEIRVGDRTFRLRASVVQTLDGKLSEDISRIGAGAAVGAIVGSLLGGGKGALLGVLVGGGGTIAATEGVDVNLAAGTVLRIRLDQPVEVLVGG
jgi:hypothetical protein